MAPKRLKATPVALGHAVAHRKLSELKSELDAIFERRVTERAVLEDVVFWHITDAHPECPPHDDPEHTVMCCVYKRAHAALQYIDLHDFKHPCAGKAKP